MTTYARIVGGQAIDVITSDPAKLFHVDVAAQFATVPDGTQNGDHFDGSAWTKYVPHEPEVVPIVVKPPVVTPPQFKILILQWLGLIYAAAQTDVEIDTFVKIIDDPRLTEVDLALNSVQTGLKYALKKIGLTDQQVADAMSMVLTGVLT